MATFPDLLKRLLADDGARPLVTFYDGATGERTELSVATYATWVAKTAALLVDELDLTRGDVLVVDLPAHWLGTIVLGAAWTAGLEVAWPQTNAEPDGVVTGPAGLDRWASYAGHVPVVATALHPLGLRFDDDLPAGVHDLGVEVWSQPDVFTAYDEPAGDDLAAPGLTQDRLVGTAAAGSPLTGGGRLLSEANPASPSGLASLLGPLASSGSLVLCHRVDAGPLERIAADERVTARFDAQPARS